MREEAKVAYALSHHRQRLFRPEAYP